MREVPEGSSCMLSVLPSLVVLGAAAFGAWKLATQRPSPPASAAERLAASQALALAVAVQGMHFAEETATGFREQLPALFGLPSMPLSFFIIFNVAWPVIWTASVPETRSGQIAAFFAGWFLAIAGVINLIAHPLLAVAAGGYFPGLISSPFIGGASIWLWSRLLKATRSPGSPSR